METRIYIGVAGWALPAQYQPEFPGPGTHLERYARVLPAVEINSTFYKPHQPKTFARWATSVPQGFKFSAKIPRTITHMKHLQHVDAELDAFLSEVQHLGDALGPLLVQLPPSLRLDEGQAEKFFDRLRARYQGAVVCEPRHPTWFTPVADDLLGDRDIGSVAADPHLSAAAGIPGGDESTVYYRFHGSPEMYFSVYDDESLEQIALTMAQHAVKGQTAWCIFDNTGSGQAQAHALEVWRRIMDQNQPSSHVFSAKTDCPSRLGW